MAKQISVIIDCDPGQDDAMMLFLAMNAPELEVRGVVAVAGNVPLEKTARNLAMIMDIVGSPDIPIYSGCLRPLMRELVTAEYVHG
jgi:purine nucleosidase